MTLTWQRTLWVAITALLVAAGLLVWNEARKEVVFLCGNFVPGVAGSSVRDQLDTGHFLRYRQRVTDTGSRIVADSAYTLGLHSCVVDLGSDDRVTGVILED